jgi:hypothetical protein
MEFTVRDPFASVMEYRWACEKFTLPVWLAR